MKPLPFLICLSIFSISIIPVSAQESFIKARLDSCGSMYRNGEYQKTINNLLILLPSLTAGSDSITAFQLIGSSFGMLDRIDNAKQWYKLALEKRPSLEIDTIENPPNITVIFNQVKLESALAKMTATDNKKPEPVVEKNNPVLPVTLLTAAVGLSAAGGYWYYSGVTIYQQYRSVNVPDQALLDKYYNEYTTQYIRCAVSLGVAAILLPVSVYLLVHHKSPHAKHLHVTAVKGSPALVYTF